MPTRFLKESYQDRRSVRRNRGAEFVESLHVAFQFGFILREGLKVDVRLVADCETCNLRSVLLKSNVSQSEPLPGDLLVSGAK